MRARRVEEPDPLEAGDAGDETSLRPSAPPNELFTHRIGDQVWIPEAEAHRQVTQQAVLAESIQRLAELAARS